MLVCGGNIDVTLLSRIIERGLVKDGRLVRLRVHLPDYPGALHRLTGILADHRANIVETSYDRTYYGVNLGEQPSTSRWKLVVPSRLPNCWLHWPRRLLARKNSVTKMWARAPPLLQERSLLRRCNCVRFPRIQKCSCILSGTLAPTADPANHPVNSKGK